MTENNDNDKIESKENNNRFSLTSKKTKTKELIEQNSNVCPKIVEPIGDLLNVDQSAVLKRSRRIKDRRDAAKTIMNIDSDEDNCFRSQYYNSKNSFVSPEADSGSDQFSTPNEDSDVSDFNLTPTPGCRAVDSNSYSQDKQKREQYHAYSRQYPNETVDELQNRRKSYWDQLDYRKKAPFFQRARDASCMQHRHFVDPETPKIPTAVRVESQPWRKQKYETPMESPVGRDIWKQFNVTYEFDQLVKDLIWERPVHFENNVKSERLSQIFRDLAELEKSGKLTCSIIR